MDVQHLAPSSPCARRSTGWPTERHASSPLPPKQPSHCSAGHLPGRQRAAGWADLGCRGSLGRHWSRSEPRRGGHFYPALRPSPHMLCAGCRRAGVIRLCGFPQRGGPRAECAEARRDGFTAKMAIHPAQVRSSTRIHAGRRPIARAHAAWSTPSRRNPGAGVVGMDGKMVDRPHLGERNASSPAPACGRLVPDPLASYPPGGRSSRKVPSPPHNRVTGPGDRLGGCYVEPAVPDKGVVDVDDHLPEHHEAIERVATSSFSGITSMTPHSIATGISLTRGGFTSAMALVSIQQRKFAVPARQRRRGGIHVVAQGDRWRGEHELVCLHRKRDAVLDALTGEAHDSRPRMMPLKNE